MVPLRQAKKDTYLEGEVEVNGLEPQRRRVDLAEVRRDGRRQRREPRGLASDVVLAEDSVRSRRGLRRGLRRRKRRRRKRRWGAAGLRRCAAVLGFCGVGVGAFVVVGRPEVEH